MLSRYVRLMAMLLCLCLLTACAGPVEKSGEAAPTVEVTEESPVAETPAEPIAPGETPWPEGYYIESARMAEQLARAELEKMRELQILAEKFYVTQRAPDYVKFFDEEPFVDNYGMPFVSVRWYCDSWYENGWAGDMPYSVVVNMDPDSGKVFYASIEAAADETTPAVNEVVEYDIETGEPLENGETWLYHENFHDLFPQGTSLADFCDRLNEYWGFSGWSLAGGGALNTGAPLEEISAGPTGNRYVVFEFDGNEYSQYMYVQIHEFPGRVCLNFGAGHSVG